MSHAERARTVVQQTAWPSGSLSQLPTALVERTPDPPTSKGPEDVDQLVTTLVPYSPSTGFSPDTIATSTPCGSPVLDYEDSLTRTIMARLIQDLLAIASIENQATIRNFLPALHATYIEN